MRALTITLAFLAALILSLIATLGGLVAGIAGVVSVIDWNQFKGVITDRASAATGRQLHLDGDLSLDLFTWSPSLVARDVKFDNADWSQERSMFEVGQLDFQMDLRALLKGQFHILGLAFKDGFLRLEKGTEDRANWDLSPVEGSGAAAVQTAAPEKRQDMPRIERLTLENFRILYLAPEKEPLEAVFDTLRAERGTEGIALDSKGKWRDVPYTLGGTLGDYEILRDADKPYPLALKMAVGGTRAAVSGSIAEPIEFTGVDAKLDLSGPSLDDLNTFLGLSLPKSPQYKLTGRLTSQGDTWKLSDFDGVLGSSDMSGSLSINTAEKIPFLKASVRSKRLDMKDLAGFIGDEDVEGAPSGAAAAKSSGPVLPDEPFGLEALRTMNAEVSYKAASILRGGEFLNDLDANLTLKDGRLSLHPISLGFAEGTISGDLVVNASRDVPSMSSNLRVRNLNLAILFKDIDPQQASWGRLSGRIKLSGSGNSVRRIASTLDGDMVLYMSEGGVGQIVLEGAALDLTQILGAIFRDQKNSDIRCAVLPFKATDGVLAADSLLLDTVQDTIVGQGTIDLANERFRFRLHAYPRDFSLFNAPSEISFGGTFRGDIEVSVLELVGEVLKKIIMMPLVPFMEAMKEDNMEPCAPINERLDRQGAR